MDNARSITVIVLKALAVGASIISILLGIIGVLDVEVQNQSDKANVSQ